MTLQQFFDKWNNQFCEVVDPSNPNQCFDLAIAYTDALGNPRIFNFLYASQIYTSFGATQAQYYDRIPNSVTAVPQAGDIVVWGGVVGHVAIATGKGDTNSFESFDQNYPTGSKCHYQTHNYDNPPVLGWLRPKKGLDQPIVDDCPAKLKQITAERDRLNGVITGKDKEIEDLKNQNSTCNSSLASLTAEKNSLAVQLAECQKTSLVYKEAYDALPQVKEEVVELVRQKQVWIDKEIQLGKEYKALQTRYLNLKKPGLKFMQDALIRLCEKMGVEL